MRQCTHSPTRLYYRGLVGMRAWRRGSCAVSMAMFSALHRTRAFIPSYNVRFGAASLLSRSSSNTDVVDTRSAAVHRYRHSFPENLRARRRHSRESGRAAVLSRMTSANSSGGVQETVEVGIADVAVGEHRWSSSKVRGELCPHAPKRYRLRKTLPQQNSEF